MPICLALDKTFGISFRVKIRISTSPPSVYLLKDTWINLQIDLRAPWPNFSKTTLWTMESDKKFVSIVVSWLKTMINKVYGDQQYIIVNKLKFVSVNGHPFDCLSSLNFI